MQGYVNKYALRAGVVAGIVGVIVLILSLIPLIGCIFGALAWIVYVGAGVLASLWGKPEGAPTTPQQGAIDGAVAGVVAGVIAHLVKWIADVGIAFVVGFVTSPARDAVTGLVVSIIGGFIFVLFGTVVAALLGGAGGLVYNAIQQQQNKPSTPTNPS